MWADTIMQASHMPLCQCTPFQNNSTSPCASPSPPPGLPEHRGLALPTSPSPQAQPVLPALPAQRSEPGNGQGQQHEGDA